MKQTIPHSRKPPSKPSFTSRSLCHLSVLGPGRLLQSHVLCFQGWPGAGADADVAGAGDGAWGPIGESNRWGRKYGEILTDTSKNGDEKT